MNKVNNKLTSIFKMNTVAKSWVIGLSVALGFILFMNQHEIKKNSASEALEIMDMQIPLTSKSLRIWLKKHNQDVNDISIQQLSLITKEADYKAIYKVEVKSYCEKDPTSCICTECKDNGTYIIK